MSPSDPSFDRISVNGVDLAYVSEGDGPLVLLLHGFPDTPHTWDHVRPALARAGYRAVSPFLRGYAPSAPAPDGRYDVDVLGQDAVALVDAFGAGRAIVVGHDWGATAAFAAAGLAPDKVRLLVTLAIPHPAVVKPSPGILWRGRHFVRFKLPAAARALRRRDFAMVDDLVRRWSPAWDVPPGETAAVKRCFAVPGSAEAAVEYYRQLSGALPRSLTGRIRVPTVSFAGETDGVLRDLDTYERARRRFESEYEVIRMPGGHFLHREHPDRFVEALLDVLRRYAS
jgi:pimeloyl-ACP methyl ester carboxylesterase